MGDFEHVVAEIISTHQPDMDKPCWANERWCRTCKSTFRTWPWSDFPAHQAALVADHVRHEIAGLGL